MLTADQIIDRLGGSAAVSRATGFPLTTIEGWKEVNFIPAWRQDRLLRLAKDGKQALATSDFPSVADRKSRRPAPTELRAAS